MRGLVGVGEERERENREEKVKISREGKKTATPFESLFVTRLSLFFSRAVPVRSSSTALRNMSERRRTSILCLSRGTQCGNTTTEHLKSREGKRLGEKKMTSSSLSSPQGNRHRSLLSSSCSSLAKPRIGFCLVSKPLLFSSFCVALCAYNFTCVLLFFVC